MSRTVLLIDDDPSILRSYARLFKRGAWSVLTAPSPKEAENLIDECDVIVTDWDMPNGGGSKVIELALHSDIPVVIHSGSSSESIHNAGAGAVLSKPTRFEKLERTLIDLVDIKISADRQEAVNLEENQIHEEMDRAMDQAKAMNFAMDKIFGPNPGIRLG